MAPIGSMMGNVGMDALEGAAQELGQAAAAAEQAVSGILGGGQGQSGGADGIGGQQGGPQNLEQELSQTLQQLSQELQQLGGGAGGGGEAGGGMPQIGGQGQGDGNIAQALGSSGMNSLNNLITDAAHSGPGSWTGDSSHVQADLTGVRNAVQSAADSGQMSEQQAAKALSDIGQGNISAVEQDLTGTAGNMSPEA